MSYTIIGGLIVVGMAIMYDSDGTMKLIVAVMSVRGVTWLVKKITQNINLDASQIIDFTGWSLAGISAIGIISNAMGNLDKVKNFFLGISDIFVSIGNFVDKLTFWN